MVFRSITLVIYIIYYDTICFTCYFITVNDVHWSNSPDNYTMIKLTLFTNIPTIFTSGLAKL